MNLRIHRFEHGTNYTVGRLYVEDQYLCFTLEDKEREVKIAGETAIPKGTYKVIIDYSNRFKRDLPRLLDVPNFTGVRIHSGNSSKDTEGCILLGLNWAGGDWVANSKDAFNIFFDKLKTALEAGEEVTITVE